MSEWEQPNNPPPPLFFNEKERNLVKQVNDALVDWGGIQTEYSTDIGLDKTSKITVHFHKRRLTEDQDLFVREGDFVLYGDIYYEIVTLSEPRQLFGQIEHKLEISATCIKSREGLFDAS